MRIKRAARFCSRTCASKASSLSGPESPAWKGGIADSNKYRRVREYKAWFAAKRRCENPDDRAYSYYGARGITFCERWNNFEAFFLDIGAAPEGMTLDRIDNDKGYSPENCRWATTRDQSLNKRNTIRLTWNGRTQSLAEWCVELNIPYLKAVRRRRKGWTLPHEILSTEKLQSRRRYA